MPVSQHPGAEDIETFPSGEPSRRRDHQDVTRIHIDGLGYESVIDRRSIGTESLGANLVRRVPNDYVKLHVGHLLRGIGPVDEGIRVVLAPLPLHSAGAPQIVHDFDFAPAPNVCSVGMNGIKPSV